MFAFSIKPTCDNAVTKSCKSETVSAYYFSSNRMSSAKRRSSNAGWPSPMSNPFKEASRLQLFIAHCNTAENKRGLKTHPCLTPEVMGKLRVDPHLPRTSPDWPSYSFDKESALHYFPECGDRLRMFHFMLILLVCVC